MWHHKLHNGGVLTRELADIGSGASMGIAALSQDLTINGQTVSPTFRYEAKNATTSLWTATVGENLTGAGSGGTVGLDTPLLTDDESVNGDGTRYWQAGNNTFADISTEDFIFECLFQTYDFSVNSGIYGKMLFGSGSDSGFIVYSSTTAINFYIRSSGSVAIASVSGTPKRAWHHLFCVADRSGSSIVYLNGTAGSAVSIAALGSLSVATPALLGFATAIGNMQAPLAYAAMWQRDAWLDTHLQASVAAERFARLNGTWSSALSKGPDQSLLRNSVATLEKQGQSGGQKLFTVGARWPRIEKRPDKYGRYATGYNSEGQHTNLFTYSEQIDNAAWTKSGGLTVTPNSVQAPNNETVADTLAEDGTTTGGRFASQTVTTVATTTYTSSVYLRAINRRWVCLYLSGPNEGRYFDVADGMIGGFLTATPDSYGIRYIGNGWYLCWVTSVAPSTSTALRVYVAEDDGDLAYTGLSQDSVYMYGAQITATAYPVSYIKTEGATVTRLADSPLQYTGLSLPSKYTLAVDMLTAEAQAAVSSGLADISDGGGTNWSLLYRAVGTSKVNAFIPAQASVPTPTDYEANKWHEVRGTFEANNVNAYIDGSAGTPDTSVVFPTGQNELNVGAYYTGTNQANALVRLRLLSKPSIKNITDFGAIMAKSSAYVSTPAAVAQSTSYANVGGTFTEVNSSDFTVSAAGVFTYTGTDTKRFACFAACSGTVSSGTPEVSTAWEKNGTEVASSVSKRDVSGSGIGAWGVAADVELANGDTLNLATKVDTGTPNLTLEACSVVIVEAGN